MAKVIKKKVDKPVEEKVVATPVKEEKPTPAKKTKAEKPAPVEKPVEEYPPIIQSKNGSVSYVRNDSISYLELKQAVENGSKYPFRVLMKENGGLTQMIVAYVGDWVNCIDLSSTAPEQKESIFRFNEGEFLDREASGFKFALYERKENEVKPITEIEEPKAVEPKPRAKKPIKK